MSTLFTDPQVYHVGDQAIDGWPPSGGRTWSKDFHLALDPGEATLVVDVFSTEAEHNEVVVNDQNIGHLARNKQKIYVASRHHIPHGVLRYGSNRIEIQVGTLDEHNHDYDDILIRNVRIVAGYEAGQEAGHGHEPAPGPDEFSRFEKTLRARLEGRRYTELKPPASINFAYYNRAVGPHWGTGTHVLAVLDARRTSERPTALFGRVRDWFAQAIGGGRGAGVLIFVYAQATMSAVKEIQSANFSDGSHTVYGGAYDLATKEHWLSAWWDVEQDIFG